MVGALDRVSEGVYGWRKIKELEGTKKRWKFFL